MDDDAASIARREELEALSSGDLHDRAVSRAARHLDVKFFWRLFEAVPAAEAAVGEMEEARDDVSSLVARANDIRHSGEGELAEALRPLYLEYLHEHGEGA